MTTPQLVFTNEYAPLILLVNGLAILFYFGARMKAKERAMKFGNYETLEKIAGRKFLHSSELILVLRLAALTTLLVGLSSPLLIYEAPSDDSDYVIALDSSSSMFTGDLEPNRFEAAKDISTGFVGELPEGTQKGLVAYSGEVENQTGLTDDSNLIIDEISSLDGGTVAGTATGDAIIAGSTLLTESSRHREVILVTDGRNNQGANISEAVSFAQRNNVSVNPIGIGEVRENETDVEEEVDVDDGLETDGEFTGFPNLEEDRLTSIANSTDGDASIVTSREGFETAFDQINTEEAEMDISTYFIFAAAILLLMEWVVSTTRVKILP